MNKTRLSLLIIGLLLVGLYLRHQFISPASTSREPNIESFVDHAQYLTTQSEVIAPLLYAKLATDMGYEIDQQQINQDLHQALAAYDDGQDAPLYLFIYIKGYAFGLAHGIEDKLGAYYHLGCQQKHPDIEPEEAPTRI